MFPNRPTAISPALDGSIYVGSQKFTSDGVFVSRLDGGMGSAIAVAPNGSIYVADEGAGQIRIFTSEGELVGKWSAEDMGGGQFAYPTGVSVASDGSV